MYYVIPASTIQEGGLCVCVCVSVSVSVSVCVCVCVWSGSLTSSERSLSTS